MLPPPAASSSATSSCWQVTYSDIGDFHQCHGASVGNFSCIVQESIFCKLRTEPNSQFPQSNLTNLPFSGETNSSEGTCVAHSVSGLISYHSQDADEEFLEINDLFDLEEKWKLYGN